MTSPKKAAPKAKAKAAPTGEPREAKIGDNNPPADTLSPFETMQIHINDLYEEALNWLDKDDIANESQAEQVTRLKGMLDEAAKTADAERAAEKKPHWDAGKAVDAKWKPIIEIADKAKRAAARKLTPWLQAIQAEKDRIAAEERAKAKAAQEALQRAHEEQQRTGNLADVERTEELERAAKEQNKAAARAAKDTSAIKTDAGRTSLRTYWLVKVNEPHLLLAHYRSTDPDWLKTVLRERAERDIRGGARNLPGCNIWSEQRAV